MRGKALWGLIAAALLLAFSAAVPARASVRLDPVPTTREATAATGPRTTVRPHRRHPRRLHHARARSHGPGLASAAAISRVRLDVRPLPDPACGRETDPAAHCRIVSANHALFMAVRDARLRGVPLPRLRYGYETWSAHLDAAAERTDGQRAGGERGAGAVLALYQERIGFVRHAEPPDWPRPVLHAA
jgi:hypothetical protein